jgi:predicted O-methyltransferase YrrM
MKNFEELMYLFTSDRSSRGICRLNIAEAALLYKYAKKKQDDIILEIGRYKGGSTVILASALTTGKVYSIDIKLYPSVKKNINPYVDKIELINGASAGVKWDSQIGLLFIDGDHKKQGVVADIKKYAPFVKEDGFIAFHDAIPNSDKKTKSPSFAIKNAINRDLLKKGWEKVEYADSVLVVRRK